MENESRIGVELTTFGSKPLEELFFGNDTSIKHTWKDWTYNKILSPRVYATERVEQLMPHFDLPEEDIEAVRVLLRGFIERKVPESFKADHSERAQQILAGRRRVQEYNCIGCHEIDGMGGYVRKYYEAEPHSGAAAAQRPRREGPGQLDVRLPAEPGRPRFAPGSRSACRPSASTVPTRIPS